MTTAECGIQRNLFTRRRTTAFKKKLWNEVEQRETRKNSTVDLRLPFQVSWTRNNAWPCTMHQYRGQTPGGRRCLYSHTGSGSDERNYHAHILMISSLPKVLPRKPGSSIRNRNRALARTLCRYLQYAPGGSTARVDHRSYKDQENGPPCTKDRKSPNYVEEASKQPKQWRNQRKKSGSAAIRMDLLIAENEIKLSALKTGLRLKIVLKRHQLTKKPCKTEGNPWQSAKTRNQRKSLDLDFMQDVFKKAENTLGKSIKTSLVSSSPKTSWKQTKSWQITKPSGSTQWINKPLLFGKKAWEAQRDAIYTNS